ncbi:MAG TPA: hypothetical protein VJ972_06245 [Anaerolineales bacterium]|nr:hypothetical protein [Anaerolineales bacterium]
MFSFTDVNDLTCEGSYADDVQSLFVDNSVWQSGSLGCVSCHNAELSNRSADLDLTSYNVLTSDSVLGSNWEGSNLKAYLEMGLTADGYSADVSAGNPLIFAGTQVEAAEETTPTP